MARHNGRTVHGRPKPQKRKNGGSPRANSRNHFQYRVFGDTPNPESSSSRHRNTPGNQGTTPETGAQTLPKWMSIFRAPSTDEADNITRFIVDSRGKALGIHRHLRHSVVAPNLARMIIGKYEISEADRLVEEYLAAHSNPVAYEVFRLFSFRGRTEIVLGANPTTDTKSALDQDFDDFTTTFDIDPNFRHRSLILGAYPDEQTCNRAIESLTETLQSQGGVLLTFSGLQTP